MNHAKETTNIATKVMAGLLAAICLYVLSYGPVALICLKTHPTHQVVRALELFYTPLFWLYSHSPSFCTFMQFYSRLWGLR